MNLKELIEKGNFEHVNENIPEYENIQVAFEDLDKNENGQRVYVKMEKSEYEAMISSVKAVRGKLDKREFADWLLAHE